VNTEGLRAPFAYKIKPYSTLGGDFLGVHNSPNGIDMLIADVAGHDLSASYHTVVVKSLFEDNVRAKYSGPTFFGILNDLLYGQGHNERMVTALFASVDLGNGYVHVVAAGYPFMMILQNSNPAPYRNFKSSSPLGMYRKPNFYEMSFMLFPKDRLLFYTDGLLNMSRIEGKTGRSERMTAQKLWEIASQNRASSLQGMVDAIWEETLEFGRHRQMDDMLIAGIEIPELEE
jgi:serine phosphatase RsbU (regulator of sigma subunit)